MEHELRPTIVLDFIRRIAREVADDALVGSRTTAIGLVMIMRLEERDVGKRFIFC
jgi:hypothetical protein